jgi:hypothetical protein
MKKIKQLQDALGEYSLRDINKLDFDLFIYQYKSESYEGSGMAIWRKNDKWSYSRLGHCSCNGPTDTINEDDKAKFSLEDVIKILENDYLYEKLLARAKELLTTTNK